MTDALTRRSLLWRGGAAAGTAALGPLAAGAFAQTAAAQGDDAAAKNVVLIVASGIRADSVGAFDGAFDDNEVAKTPNLDDLAGDALRFERAVPEATLGVPSRRALVTGKRSFPYREWRRHEGFAPVPGWNPVYIRQPLMTEVLADEGIETTWITDNPFFSGPRFDDMVIRTGDFSADDFEAPKPVQGTLGSTQTHRDVEKHLVGGIERGATAMDKAVDLGIRRLERRKEGKRFFLAVDAFDPAEAYHAPRHWTRTLDLNQSVGTLVKHRDWLVSADIGHDTVAMAREAYTNGLERIDGSVGRLLKKVKDLDLEGDTVVWFVSDGGTMLGEHGWVGRGAPGTYKHAHFVPFLLRDPKGRRGGDHTYYYASTHDVAPTILSLMGIDRPGRMDGEDLTALLDDEDPPKRGAFMCASVCDFVAGDPRWLMVSDMAGDEKQLRDFDNENSDFEDEEDENVVRKHPLVVEELWKVPLAAAGGTFPVFGADGPIRPPIEDEDADDDGIEDDDEINDDNAGTERDADRDDRDFDESRSGRTQPALPNIPQQQPAPPVTPAPATPTQP
jgi:arylsulfatase A-like enzyme